MQTYAIEDIAELTGRSPSWLKRHWLRFHTDHGFPRPLPGCHWRWPRVPVDLWCASGGRVSAADSDQDNTPGLVELTTRQLLAKYGNQA